MPNFFHFHYDHIKAYCLNPTCVFNNKSCYLEGSSQAGWSHSCCTSDKRQWRRGSRDEKTLVTIQTARSSHWSILTTSTEGDTQAAGHSQTEPRSWPQCQSRSSMWAQTTSVRQLIKIPIKVSPIGYILNTCFILATTLRRPPSPALPHPFCCPGTHIPRAAADLGLWGPVPLSCTLWAAGDVGPPFPQTPLTSSQQWVFWALVPFSFYLGLSLIFIVSPSLSHVQHGPCAHPTGRGNTGGCATAECTSCLLFVACPTTQAFSLKIPLRIFIWWQHPLRTNTEVVLIYMCLYLIFSVFMKLK